MDAVARLQESLQPDRVKLVLPMVSLIPDEVDRALHLRFGDQFAKLDKAAVQTLVRDGLLTQQNQRRWASCRVAEDSPQFDRLADLSDEVRALLPVAEPARKNKKLPVPQLQTIIQRLCVGRWLSTSELAALVDRDAEKLQTRFLTAMVKSSVLELRFPDVRNRPDQAYRAVDSGAVAVE